MRIFIIYIIAFMLYSCSSPNGNKKDNSKVESITEEHTVIDTLLIDAADTIEVGKYQLLLEPADSSYIPDFHEQHELKISGGQTGYFRKNGKELWLYLHNGDSTLLTDHEKDAYRFFFFAYLPKIDYYLVREEFPEGSTYVLVNRKYGARKSIWGLPFMSPSSKQIISINADIVAGHSPNGIQLLSVSGDSLKFEFQLFLKEWGPGAVKWYSDSSILIQRIYPLYDEVNSRVHFKSEYSTMLLKKNL